MIEKLTGDNATGVKRFTCELNEIDSLPKTNMTNSSSAMVIEDTGEVKEFLFKRTSETDEGKWILKKNAVGIGGGVEQEYVDEKILEVNTTLATKVDKATGKVLSTNDYTSAEKTKLAGLNNYIHPTTSGNKHLPTGGSANQILKWSVDGTGIWGDNVVGVTKEYVDSGLSKKVDSVVGKDLSSNDYTTVEKTKLTGLSNYVHPTTTGNKHIPTGGVANQILRWASDGTATWGADTNTTYSASTTTVLGLSKKCAVQDDSVATTIEELVVDFNSLLAKLKVAGLM